MSLLGIEIVIFFFFSRHDITKTYSHAHNNNNNKYIVDRIAETVRVRVILLCAWPLKKSPLDAYTYLYFVCALAYIALRCKISTCTRTNTVWFHCARTIRSKTYYTCKNTIVIIVGFGSYTSCMLFCMLSKQTKLEIRAVQCWV